MTGDAQTFASKMPTDQSVAVQSGVVQSGADRQEKRQEAGQDTESPSGKLFAGGYGAPGQGNVDWLRIFKKEPGTKDLKSQFPDVIITQPPSDKSNLPAKERPDRTEKPADRPPSIRDQIQKPASLIGTMGDPLARLQAVRPEEIKAYFHRDGNNLPPIADDFKQIALNSLKEKEAQDLLKPQIHVSTRPGNQKFPLGSRENPYTSIQAAVDKAPSGSVINVHRVGNDTYRAAVNIKRSDIVLQTDRDNPAVLDMQEQSGERGAISVGSGVHNVDIKNFDIRNFSGFASGIRVDGNSISNINIVNNNVHHAGSNHGVEGISVYGRGQSEATKISNINLLGNSLHDLALAEKEGMPINGNVSDFKVIGNRGYRMDNIFIDTIGYEDTSKNDAVNQARHGLITFNYADGISTINNPNSSCGGQYSAAAIYSDAGKDLVIRNNYVSNSDFGITLGSEHVGKFSSDSRVSGNVIDHALFKAFGLGGDPGRPGGARNSLMENNTLIANADIERQRNIENVEPRNNPGYKSIDTVRYLPTIIAELARTYGQGQR